MSTLLLILARQDQRALHALVLRRRALADRMMRGITHLGDAWFTLFCAGALAIGFVPHLQSAGVRIAFTLVMSHLLVQLLKRTVTRPRPRLPVGCASLIDAPDRFSFPSGHAAASMSVMLPLALEIGGVIAIVLFVIGTLVGISRCYLGVHYPGDVLIGWLLAGSALMMGVAANVG